MDGTIEAMRSKIEDYKEWF